MNSEQKLMFIPSASDSSKPTVAGMCHCRDIDRIDTRLNDLLYTKPRKMSSLFAGAFGEKKSGIVFSVRLGLFNNSTSHSVNRCSFT